MIKVETVVRDENEGRRCTILGSTTDIVLDITTIFEALSKNEELELVLLECIDSYIKRDLKKLSNKKGDK